MRRRGSLAALGALLLAVSTADAGAHVPTPMTKARVAAASVEPPASTVPVTVDLPDTWSCTGRTDDDVAHALSAGPVYKVVYAYTTDRGNRFGEWATTIQRMVERSMNMVANPARDGSRAPGRTVRFDLGTACHPLEADIQTVALPRAASDYPQESGPQLRALVEDLKPALGAAVQRNVVALIDGVSNASAWGIAETAPENFSGDANTANGGNRYSVVLPRDGLAPSTPTDPFGWGSYEDSIDTAARVMTHEILHNLGAVGSSAPAHNGLGNHSRFRGDIMFSGGGQDSPQCPAYAAQHWEIDCLGDSYFNPSPSPGSWLASHWNIVNSVHLCPLERCTTRSHPPAIRLDKSADAHAGEAVTLHATASDADGDALGPISWDLDGDAEHEATGPSPSVTFSEPGFRTVAARVTDSNGEFGIAQARIYVWPPRPAETPATTTSPSSQTTTPTVSDPTTTSGSSGGLSVRLRSFPSKLRLRVLRRNGLPFYGTASDTGYVRVAIGVARKPLAHKRVRVERGSFRGRIRLPKSALRYLRRLPATLMVMIGPEDNRTRPTIGRIKIVR